MLSPQVNSTFLWNFVPNSELCHFFCLFLCHAILAVTNLSLSSADQLCQFVKMNIHLCVQYDGLDAAHHIGSSATADFSALTLAG